MKNIFLTLILMTVPVFGQLTITTNTAQNKYNFSWPVSQPNVFLYKFYHYGNSYLERWQAMPVDNVTSDGTNYYTYDTINTQFFPTNVDYQLRPSFSTTVVWPQITDTNLSWYDVHFVGTGGFSYGKVADKSQISMAFPFLDPTMLPWNFYVYKRVGATTNTGGLQYQIKQIVVTTTGSNLSTNLVVIR